MFKRYLLAVIVALLVTSSQIVAAEDYDWRQAKRIGTKAEFASYVESERRKCQTVFHIVLTNGLKVDNKDFFYLAPGLIVNKIEMEYTDKTTGQKIYVDGAGTTRMIYEITEYPGTRVANAYLGYISWLELTYEEQKLYSKALGIVDEANKRSSEIEKARYIHKVICNIVSYHDEKDKFDESGAKSFNTAIGALNNGQANCMGISDAFYMICRMCNLDVRKIGGMIKDSDGQWGEHQWNAIIFNDGRAYCSNVTNGVCSKSEYLFNATFERMKDTYWCEWEIIPNLQ